MNRTPRRRLLLTIYFVALAQLVVVGVAIVVVHRLLERAPYQHEPSRQKVLLDSFGEFFESPELLARALDRLVELDVSFYDSQGALKATSVPPLAPLSAADLARLRTSPWLTLPTEGPVPITAVPVLRDGKLVGYGLVHRRPIARNGAPTPLRGPPPLIPPSSLPIIIAIALLSAALTSLVVARMVAQPLDKLAAAARAFGAGDLAARANLPRKDELGEVAATFDDMAERVNQMLRAQREFLANVSHELRTPLARIRVALDLAAEGEPELAKQSLAEIAEDWRDLDRLVEDILTVARFDLAKHAEQRPGGTTVPLRYETADAVEILDRAAVDFRRIHRARELQIDDAAGPLPCYVDRAMVRRVLDNLLNNAAAYSDAATSIHLAAHRARDDERQIEIVVEDHGIGIEEGDLGRLFTPFFRTDRSRARKSGGVGLGLALARRIVEAHGGTIALSSKVGVGTKVSVRLPVEPPVGASATP